MRLEKRLFSSSYTAFSEMVVTDRTESPLSGISNKNTFKRKQVFYDLVDEYWNEDFWRNYNIIDLRNPWRMQSVNCGNNPIDYLIVSLYLEQPRKNTVYAGRTDDTGQNKGGRYKGV